ncbi:MAG: hypothetical protein EBR86_07050 [Planctomycetia bacterium]|nr:hypothetical protein [Planctomycetia bacterium]
MAEGRNAEGKAGATRPEAGSVISFQCPNGHRINVSARLAGKRGACSKCGVDVVIPAATPTGPGPPHATGVPSGPPVGAPAFPPQPVRPAPAPVVPLVHAPAGSVAPAKPVVMVAPSPDDSTALDALFGAVGAGARPEEENTIMMNAVPREWTAPETTQPSNATAQLVARLWAEREHGGIVELHVTGGSVILPEWYEPRWSSGSHGLFASQAADGSVTLTAVAWDSIQKIVVRQVEGLPDGMFE